MNWSNGDPLIPLERRIFHRFHYYIILHSSIKNVSVIGVAGTLSKTNNKTKSKHMKTTQAKLITIFAGLAIFAGQLSAKTVTINASNSDQTSYFRGQVGLSVDGDTLVLASGNHYISGFIDIWFNNGFINGGGSIVRKIAGSTSGLTIHVNGNRIDQIEIDGGGTGTHGPCMVLLNGKALTFASF